MSRVIDPNSTGKIRNRLSRQIALAVRELAQRQGVDEETRDLVAFVIVSLEYIAKGIDQSVAAWEKRDYWVKADRFRLEWEWAGETAAALRDALQADDWAAVALLIARVAQKFSHIKISPKHRMGRPWVGAWKRLSQEMG